MGANTASSRRTLTAILSFIISIAHGFSFSGNANNRVIFDVTKLFNGNDAGKLDRFVRSAYASPENTSFLFYKTDEGFRDFFDSLYFLKLNENLQGYSQELGRPFKSILSFRSDRLGDDLPQRTDLFHDVGAIIINFHHNGNCHTSTSKSSGKFLLNPVSSSGGDTETQRHVVPTGLGLHQTCLDDARKNDYFQDLARMANFVAVTLDFATETGFAESYSIFEDYLISAHHKVEELLSTSKKENGENGTSPVFILNLSSGKTGDHYDNDCRYFSLLKHYSAKFSSKYNSSVIIEINDSSPLDISNCTADDFKKVTSITGKNRYGTPGYDSKHIYRDYNWRENFKIISTTFDSIYMLSEGWDNILKSWANDTCDFDFHRPIDIYLEASQSPTGFMHGAWQNVLKKAKEYEERSNCPQIKLKSIGSYMQYPDDNDNSTNDTYSREELSKDIQLSCVLVIGDTKDPHNVSSIMEQMRKECLSNPNLKPETSLWALIIDFNEYIEGDFSFKTYTTLLQPLLYQVYLAKLELPKQFNMDVVIRVVERRPRWLDGANAPLGFYCSRRTYQMNTFYEAMINWGWLHDTHVSLKDAMDTVTAKARVGFMTYLNPTKEFLNMSKQTPFVRISNYPEIEGWDLQSPCVNKTEEVDKSLEFDRSHMGVALDYGLCRLIPTIEESHTLLEVVLEKFDRVEIVDETIQTLDLPLLLGSFSRKLVTKFGQEGQPRKSFHIQLEYKEFPLIGSMSNFVDKFAELNSKLIRLEGIHISNWRQMPQEEIDAIVKWRRVPVGLTIHDWPSIIQTIHDDPSKQLPKVDYVVLVMDPFPGTNRNVTETISVLDNIFFLRELFHKFAPGIQVHFRIQTLALADHNMTNKMDYLANAEHFLRFMNDLNQYAPIHNLSIFFSDAIGVGLERSRRQSWWRVKNCSNLYNHTEFVEVEEEYFYLKGLALEGGYFDETSFLETTWFRILLIIACICLLLTVIILVVVNLRMRGQRITLTEKEVEEFLNGRMGFSRLDDDEDDSDCDDFECAKFDKKYDMEKSDFVFLSKKLGEGNFGTVHQAIVKGVPAAVKIPNNRCNLTSFKSLLTEIKVMCHLGNHPNIVCLVGCYVKELSVGVIYVASVLCDNGSLEKYLRNLEKDAGIAQQLIQFCYDIASGMEYIAGKKVVHGDLSTRNVMLDSMNTCRIGDFGLSRKLYQYQQYVKKSSEPLPWRWMAYEALNRLEFTTKSDVWSYGITVWEIFTLGDIPYPNLSWDDDFRNALESGMRLKKPDLAPDDIYKKMVDSWHIDPAQRPSFTEIRDHLGQLVQREYMNRNMYINT